VSQRFSVLPEMRQSVGPRRTPTGLVLGAICSIDEHYCPSSIELKVPARRFFAHFEAVMAASGNRPIWQFSCGLICEGVVQNLSWFRCLAIAAPTALIAAMAIAALVGDATVRSDSGQTNEPRLADPGLAGGLSGGPPETSRPVSIETFSGVITDDHCAARHDMWSGMSASECSRVCVRRDANYVLVDGDKSYRLEGNANELGIFSGTRVELTGSLAGNRIQVSSIAIE
jgi:hypothetical protein